MRLFLFPILFFLVLIPIGAFSNELNDAESAYATGEFAKAATLLRPLVEAENSDALYLMARMYERGDGVKKDFNEAKHLFQLAADQGHQKSGQRLEQLTDSKNGNDSVVLEWYLPMAKEGDPEAQYHIGFMYETGWGVVFDEEKSVKWYKEAASFQHDMAQLRLGMMILVGAGGDESEEQGIQYIRNAAENGNRIAEMLVQDLFDAVDAENFDFIKIVSGLRRVIDDGENAVIVALTRSLESARSSQLTSSAASRSESTPRIMRQVTIERVENNLFRPEKVITETQAPRKNSQSQRIQPKVSATQVTQLTSDTAENDINQEALNKYYLAAEEGDPNAQFELGVLYMQGRNVPQDHQEGLRWFNEAAKKNHSLAKAYLQLWENNLDEKALADTVGVTWLKEEARSLDAEALYWLGFLYESGRGVEQNPREAKKWYQLAAAQGQSEAQRRMTLIQIADPIDDISPAQRSIMDRIFNMDNMGAGLAVGMLLMVSLIAFHDKIPVKRLLSLFKHSAKKATPSGFPSPVEAEDLKFINELWGNNKEADTPNAVPAEASAKSEKVPPSKNSSEQKSATENKSSPSVVEKPIEQQGSGKAKEPEPVVIAVVSNAESGTIRQDNASQESHSVAEPVSNVPKRMDAESHKESDQKSVETSETRVSERQDQAQHGEPITNKAKINLKNKMSRTELSVSPGFDVLNADDISVHGISRHELAIGRISAETLYGDKTAIDKAGKVLGRGRTRPDKLNAETLLANASPTFSEKHNIHVSSNDITLSDQRLLPKQKNDIALKPDTAMPNPHRKPVDVHAPLTEEEEKSLAEVHHNIGLMFLNGDGVPQSDSLAAKWYEKAANEGLPEAQLSLSELYLDGIGVPKDIAQAIAWLKKSAEGGHPEAIERLKQIKLKKIS